jgi:hypothetical protein
MTLITIQDGKLVLRDGAIGTEQACCCAKCSGPCDENEDCAPGCACVDGECVPTGACCYCQEYSQRGGAGGGFSTDDVQDFIEWENTVKADAFREALLENGFSCVRVEPAFIADDSNEENVNVQESFIYATCCGTLDNENIVNVDLEEYPGPHIERPPGPYVINPCLPPFDNVLCIDDKTASQCQDLCGHQHNEGQSCEDDPCNPLP